MKLHTALMAATMGLSIAWTDPAFAVPVSGTSSGAFSNLTGCDTQGSDRECGIVSSSNGANTQVRWPYLDHNDQIDDASRLTAVDININTTTSTTGVVIGRLDWFNAATDASDTPDSLGVSWTLSISFSNPNVSMDTEAFGLSILNPGNPNGDSVGGFTIADLTNLSFNLAGWTINDFHYSVLDGAGDCGGTDTSLNGTTWYNCENNMASLLITANFQETATSAVQEPATLALLAAGLFGLAAVRRRKTA